MISTSCPAPWTWFCDGSDDKFGDGRSTLPNQDRSHLQPLCWARPLSKICGFPPSLPRNLVSLVFPWIRSGTFRLRECAATFRTWNCSSERRYGRPLCSRRQRCQGGKRACSESGTNWRRASPAFSHRRLLKGLARPCRSRFWRDRAEMFIHHCASANAVPILMRT